MILCCATRRAFLVGFHLARCGGQGERCVLLEEQRSGFDERRGLLQAMREHTDLKVVHIGSLALTLEPIGEVILEALERYEPKPIVFLDPNVRPSVIDDWDRYRIHIEKAVDLASIVKLSDEDLESIYPDADVHAKAAELARTKKKHIIHAGSRRSRLAWP